MSGKRAASKHKQAGFTMVEMLTVTAVLVVVMGVVFSYTARLQRAYKTEETRVDATEEARTFLDGLARELHQAGYPSHDMFAASILASPANNDSRVAAGLVKVSASDLWFEADIDNDGVVESVRYTLYDYAGGVATASSTCPCSLRRSQVQKANNTAPTSQNTNYTSELDRVVNSAGLGAGGGALTISGNTIGINNQSLSLDTLYSNYKSAPLFIAYDQNGAIISLPVDLSSNPSVMSTIRSVGININLLAESVDAQTNVQPALSMRETVKITSY
jgi:prepilin-type N-terminal cleavage/methylation domain-containing protein